MAKKVRLAAVIITFNEERNIARCLASVKNVVDEIVVVDSFSTDKTAEICQSFGVKFVQHPFHGHIEQKNYAITKANTPHILSLDADEALTPPLQKAIQQVKQDWTHDAYQFKRCTNFCGKWVRHGSWYPDKKLRLWDARKGRWQGLNPHDRFELDNGTNGTTKYIPHEIAHYSYYTLEEYQAQIAKFSTISAKALLKKGKKAKWHHLLFNPFWRWLKGFVLKGGFMLGKTGWIIEKGAAYETYLKYQKLREMQKASS